MNHTTGIINTTPITLQQLLAFCRTKPHDEEVDLQDGRT